MRVTFLLLVAIAFHVVAPTPLHAYIDPSAGSLVFQVAAGVILGGMLTIRKWWTTLGGTAKQIWRNIRRR